MNRRRRSELEACLVVLGLLCMSCGIHLPSSRPMEIPRGVSRIDHYDGPLVFCGNAWSPDGTELAVTADKPGAGPPQQSIYVLDVSTGALRLLLSADYGVRWVTDWSPGGKEIAFWASPYEEGIWVVNADGSGEPRFVSDGHAAAWSPGGGEMAIFDWVRAQEGGPWIGSIWILDLDSGERRLVFGPWELVAGGDVISWSPDGTRLAFEYVARRTGQDGIGTGVYVLDLSTGTVAELTNSGENGDPTWSPDGSLVAYVSRVAGESTLIIARTDGRCSVEAVRLEFLHSPAWSPDGRKISFCTLEGMYVLDIASVLGEEFLEVGPVCP